MKEQIDKAELQEFVITLSDCQHKFDKEVNKAIVTGTPLPKENQFYARYLIEQGYRKQSEGEWRSELIKRCDWKGKKHDYYQPNSCSLCHEAVLKRTPFCPNCGAKMKGTNDEKTD